MGPKLPGFNGFGMVKPSKTGSKPPCFQQGLAQTIKTGYFTIGTLIYGILAVLVVLGHQNKGHF